MQKKKIEIIVVQLGPLVIFEISEDELNKIESGYTNSVLPSLTAFFLSSSLTLHLSLFNISDNELRIYYSISLWISIVFTVIFFLFTCINYLKNKNCINNIRNRKQAKGTGIS